MKMKTMVIRLVCGLIKKIHLEAGKLVEQDDLEVEVRYRYRSGKRVIGRGRPRRVTPCHVLAFGVVIIQVDEVTAHTYAFESHTPGSGH